MGGGGRTTACFEIAADHVARHMTDMEVVSTYEGTDSIQALLVGRDITGISTFRRP